MERIYHGILLGATEKATLHIKDEDIGGYWKRLDKLVEDHKAFMDWQKDAIDQLSKSAFLEQIEQKLRAIGFRTPLELNNSGVGETFLVMWDNHGRRLDGGEKYPMEIAIAWGKEIGKIYNINCLLVDYFRIGALTPGTAWIKTDDEKKGVVAKSIYLTSSVVYIG